jgi:hypothetical protein
MTHFQADVIATVLDILAFLCVTSDLYGHWLTVVDKAKSDIVAMDEYKLARDVLTKVLTISGTDPLGINSFILRMFEKLPVKHILLYYGTFFFLAARGVYLWFSYFHG